MRGVAMVALGILLAGGLTVMHGQSRTASPRRAENVVQGVRQSWERRPADFRTRTASCLHYLDEAEARHSEGVACFEAASRARSSAEQTPLVRKGNEAIAERTRLIKEFWACTRRMTTGDEFHSQGPPRAPGKDQPPPDDPITPPPVYVPPPESPTPPASPAPGPILPPGFPFPPAEARDPRRTDRPGTPSRPGPGPVPVIVALGDSITAGQGLPPADKYPQILQLRLQREGYRYHVTNAGVSGDTAAGARRRLSAALGPNTKFLIVALGSNDAWKGRPVADIRADLIAIITTAQARRITVLLCGFSAPPVANAAYERDFEKMFGTLAATHHVAFLDDLMSIVWNDPPRYTLDAIHPNAAGSHLIASQVFRALKPLLGVPAPAPSPPTSPAPRFR